MAFGKYRHLVNVDSPLPSRDVRIACGGASSALGVEGGAAEGSGFGVRMPH